MEEKRRAWLIHWTARVLHRQIKLSPAGAVFRTDDRARRRANVDKLEKRALSRQRHLKAFGVNSRLLCNLAAGKLQLAAL